jgi:hypothetical protein
MKTAIAAFLIAVHTTLGTVNDFLKTESSYPSVFSAGLIGNVPNVSGSYAYDQMVAIGEVYCKNTPECKNYLILKNTGSVDYPAILMYDHTMTYLTTNTDWDAFISQDSSPNDFISPNQTVDQLQAPLLVGSFKVCGSFCGPGWCNNQWLAESQCDYTSAPDDCADSCCQTHDACCGHGERSTCNKAIAECILQCGIPTSFTEPCSNPLVAPLMTTFMAAIGGRCCGEVCPDGPNWVPPVYVMGCPPGYNYVAPQGMMKAYCDGGAGDYPKPQMGPTCPTGYNLVPPQGTMKAYCMF